MLILALLAAAAEPGDGKIMMQDDWQSLAIYGVGGGAAGPLYLQVHAGDLDGDGSPDDAVVKLVCAGGQVRQAHYLLTAGGGGGSGGSGGSGMRRQHSGTTIVKEWGPATPQLREIKPSYDVKTVKSARVAQDGWTELTLARSDGLCGATEAAAATIVKSKSNITNN